jgi:hypothetical protein
MHVALLLDDGHLIGTVEDDDLAAVKAARRHT